MQCADSAIDVAVWLVGWSLATQMSRGGWSGSVTLLWMGSSFRKMQTYLPSCSNESDKQFKKYRNNKRPTVMLFIIFQRES